MLNEGLQSAFRACVVLAGIGMALALLLLVRPRGPAREQLELEPSPALAADLKDTDQQKGERHE